MALNTLALCASYSYTSDTNVIIERECGNYVSHASQYIYQSFKLEHFDRYISFHAIARQIILHGFYTKSKKVKGIS